MPHRFALYYAPSPDSALWRRAAAWLGRDAASGVEQPAGGGQDAARIFRVTESARRYGFHATLKAPMRLAEGQTRRGLEDAMAAFAARTAPVRIEKLVLRALGGFLALVPAAQDAALTGLAHEIVEEFEPFRAPLSAADMEKRLQSGLSEKQQAYLARFGYPYVADEFRFHMTLTDRLAADDIAPVTEAAQAFFADFTDKPLLVDQLALFSEPEAGAPFRREKGFALLG